LSHKDEAKGLQRAAIEARRIAEAVEYRDGLTAHDRLIQLAEWCKFEAGEKLDQHSVSRPALVAKMEPKGST